jgi:hypothetical protein
MISIWLVEGEASNDSGGGVEKHYYITLNGELPNIDQPLRGHQHNPTLWYRVDRVSHMKDIFFDGGGYEGDDPLIASLLRHKDRGQSLLSLSRHQSLLSLMRRHP